MAFETRVAVVDADLTAGEPTATQSMTEQLVDQHLEEFKGALVNHVTAHFQNQKQLLESAEHNLEETRRELAVYKKAFLKAERDRHDLEEENQALINEIRKLRECGARGRDELFERERRALNDGIPQLEATMTPEQRAAYQEDPSPTPADSQQHAIVRGGTPTA